MIHQLLVAEPVKAREMLPELCLFHPREIAERLVARFDKTKNSRERRRAVWAAGELCGHYGLDFLARCACSGLYEIRRLAASALGKAAGNARTESRTMAEGMEKARNALFELLKDPATQVRQYAKKSLDQFDSKESQGQ